MFNDQYSMIDVQSNTEHRTLNIYFLMITGGAGTGRTGVAPGFSMEFVELGSRMIGGGGTLSPNRRSGPPPPPVVAKLDAKWLFLPMAFLATLLVGLVAWGLSGLVRHRRASRKYAEALGYNSSSNPS